MALRRNAGVVTGEAMLPIVERLAALRLVHLYERNGSRFGVIDHFDEDITLDHTKKRPRPSHPSPPPGVWSVAGCSGMYRGGQDGPASEPEPITDRSLTDQRSDGERLQTEKKEREVITRERARTAPRTAPNIDDQLVAVAETCRKPALAWLIEMAKVRRRHGGALFSECKADEIAHEYAKRLGEIADVGTEAFTRGVEIMIERGKGFGRGMPGEGLGYLEKIVRNWTAEQDNEKKAKRRRRMTVEKGDGFRRLGPAPQPGEVDRTVDDSLSDVMEG
tara:strand:+ start:963 stop:1793 length:831 start_codon:yes stop_codon:yes gene_type:complete